MALKFATTSSRFSSAEVGCSEEALIESIENVAAAAEALYEVGADGAELCQVMDNLNLAMAAIENGGLTPELLATFNSEGELSACCGQENLTVEGLEGLADKQVEALEAKYIEGLEGKLAEYWAKFVQWLKNLWTKIVNWFKNIFINRAKYVKALGAVSALTPDVYNGKAKYQAWMCPENVTKNLGVVEDRILKAVASIDQGNKFDKTEAKNAVKIIEDAMNLETKEKSVEQQYGDCNAFKKAVSDYIAIAKSNTMQNTSKRLTGALDKLIKEAGKAANAADAQQGAMKERIVQKREDITFALSLIRTENRWVMKKGSELLKAYNAAKSTKETK